MAKDVTAIKRDLAKVINSHSLENDSDTPDFILAEYLYGCLEAFNDVARARRAWGEIPK